MKIANFGSDVKFVNESYPLPTDFTFGMAMNTIERDNHKLLVSASAIKPNDGGPLPQFGAEWSFQDIFFIRAGLRYNRTRGTSDVLQALPEEDRRELRRPLLFSFGGGLQTAISQYGFSFDYAYSDYDLLGGAHRFGVGFSF